MHSGIKELGKGIIAAGQWSTAILDKIFSYRTAKLPWPPIFIVGTPRSGTTLLYQMLIHRFEFAYVPNVANSFYMCPIFATRTGLKLFPPYKSTFKSNFGYEKGWMSPSEAGNIWNRWFPHEKREGYNYTPEGFLSERDRNEIASMIANFSIIYQRPFLTKNVKMAVRLRAIREIFPDALFLHISRNFIDSAVSLLIKRRRDHRAWISVMPRDMDRIRNKSELEQVAAQIYFVEQDLLRDIRIFDKSNYMKIEYKKLCERPEQIMDGICHFLESRNVQLTRKDVQAFSGFSVAGRATSRYITELEVAKIEKILKKLSMTA